MKFLKILLLLGCLCFVGTSLTEDAAYIDEEYDDVLEANSTNESLQLITGLSNTTKFQHENLTLTCEVRSTEQNATNGKVNVQWFHFDSLIVSNKNIKLVTKKDFQQNKISSHVRIKSLKLTDAGLYSCLFTKNNEKLKSEAFVGIIAHAESTIQTSTTPAKPTKTTFLNSHSSTISSLSQITEEHITPPSTVSSLGKKATLKIENQEVHETPAVYNASQPFCQRYVGKTCQLYLGNQYVFIQPPYTQESIENNINEAYLVVSQSNDISFECSNYVLPSLCYSAFPICGNAQRIHLYQQQYLNKKITADKLNKSFKNLRNQLTIHLQRICKGDCLILETELCSREYAIAKHHPIISKVLDLEECANLPDESEKDSSNCLKLGMDGTKVDKEDTCYWRSGTDYRGIHGLTISGKECIRWAGQYQIPLNKHPELLGHSYCRNPGGIEMEPFCYVDQNTKESCGLRKCLHSLLIYIAAATGIFLVFLATAITIICYRKKTKTRNIQNINTPSADKNIYGNGGPSSPIELNTLLLPPGSSGRNQNKNCFQNIPNYSYKEVNFLDELGEGAFGKVYKGELKAKTGKIFVAVKSLKEGASAKTQADFQREIELISELKHPNIICLLGIVVKQEPMCMLFEYMTEGDLHEFLIGNSPNNGKSLTQTQFLHIAIQIAQGMEYLSDNHYVHRDLAARNCLVTNDLVVKISDFGLSRDMYSCDYYRVQSKSLLPVRWMPPESILYGKFTTESDIWSYGVVLWEIYSYGLQPYYGYNNQEVINMIRARKLLPCPDCCPSYCYSLMVECWAELSIRRPSFGEISHRLRVWKQTAGSQTGAYFKTPDVVTNPQKLGNNSKSTTSMDSPPSLCPVFENQNDPSLTWERNLKKATAARLSESQSSLTSRTSSIGNRNHSSGLNDPLRGSKKSIDRLSQKKYRPEGSLDRGNHRNVIVSTNGENIETKLT